MRIARALVAVLPVVLPGCSWCETDHELAVVRGAPTLRPGERVTLVLDSEGYYAGPQRCGGRWYVDGFEGGNLERGIVTRCGVFIASHWPRQRPYTVTIEATRYGLDGCADCCPYGRRTITVTD